MVANSRRNTVAQTPLGKEILRVNLAELYRDTDRIFVYLLIAQWALAITFAVLVSPYSWAGRNPSISFHLETAIVFGGILTCFPLWLLRKRSGEAHTRYVVTCTQALWSALLIHLTGGRVETHFHVFGSLAFVAFYRDWKLLLPASLIIAGSHFLGIFYMQNSMYGVDHPAWWRFIEHSAWVAFEDIFLTLSCIKGYREMQASAERQAELEAVHDKIQSEVDAKTAELMESSKQHDRLQMELLQAHKLESVGRLAAGIAHEINTPIQYVTDSVCFAREGIDDLLLLIQQLQQLDSYDGTDEEREKVKSWVRRWTQSPDIDYLRENLPEALERSSDGLSRVAEIIRSMKSFAHPDRREMVPADLNEAIHTTLVVCRNEYKYIADVVTDLAEIPLVTCHVGEINQVLINLIINAAHAISEKLLDPSETGTITIRTRSERNHVVIEVSDNGCGIPEENRERIFEPFFTTKGIGRGTGQGLAVVHGLIVQKLGGQIVVDSKPGVGTTFRLSIPINQEAEVTAA